GGLTVVIASLQCGIGTHDEGAAVMARLGVPLPLCTDDRAGAVFGTGAVGYCQKSRTPFLYLGFGARGDRPIRQDLRNSRKMLGPKSVRARRRWRSCSTPIQAFSGTTFFTR